MFLGFLGRPLLAPGLRPVEAFRGSLGLVEGWATSRGLCWTSRGGGLLSSRGGGLSAEG